MFDSVIAIVCSEELSGEGLYHMETSELICFANQLTSFHMMLVFAERYFWTDDNVVIVLNILSIFSNYCQQ